MGKRGPQISGLERKPLLVTETKSVRKLKFLSFSFELKEAMLVSKQLCFFSKLSNVQ